MKALINWAYLYTPAYYLIRVFQRRHLARLVASNDKLDKANAEKGREIDHMENRLQWLKDETSRLKAEELELLAENRRLHNQEVH